jgi:hypothetical protein
MPLAAQQHSTWAQLSCYILRVHRHAVTGISLTRLIDSCTLDHLRLCGLCLHFRCGTRRLRLLSTPRRTLPGNITWWPGSLCRHGLLIRRRRQFRCIPINWRGKYLPVEKIWIGTNTSAPSSVSWRWIRQGLDIFVPSIGIDCKFWGSGRFCFATVWSNFVGWHVYANWRGWNVGVGFWLRWHDTRRTIVSSMSMVLPSRGRNDDDFSLRPSREHKQPHYCMCEDDCCQEDAEDEQNVEGRRDVLRRRCEHQICSNSLAPKFKKRCDSHPHTRRNNRTQQQRRQHTEQALTRSNLCHPTLTSSRP